MGAVSGPVTVGEKGWPFGRPNRDFDAVGYREEEYFLEGTATRFRPRPGTDLDWHGHWEVEPAGTAPYRTRFVVYRPIDPHSFNGTVLVSWNNVSAGFDGYTVDSAEVLESGYAYVAVSAQRAGVHGMGEHPMGLIVWDPLRYGSLSIPSDDYSFDIFTQAGRAVAPDRSRQPVDPLGGLEVRHLVAIGGSQSASRLAAYINVVQPQAKVFDAFLPFLYFGGGSPLEVGEEVFNPAARRLERSSLPMVPCLIRDDIDALVMIVNSEVEAISCYGVRQPDTSQFRYWEAAGTAHISLQSMQARAAAVSHDVGDAAVADFTGINEVPLNPVVEAAHHWLQSWLETGTPPPVQPRIEFAGDPPEVVRDVHGVARGGIRLPQVAVPLATNSAMPASGNHLGFLGGSCVPFTTEKVLALYRDVDTYLSRFEQATRAAEKAGVVLARDVEPLLSEARKAYQRAIAST
jgi:Alpha/beta hydrolase domain